MPSACIGKLDRMYQRQTELSDPERMICRECWFRRAAGEHDSRCQINRPASL